VQLLSWNSAIMSNYLSVFGDVLLQEREGKRENNTNGTADVAAEDGSDGGNGHGEGGAGGSGASFEAFSVSHQVVQCLYCSFSEEPDTALRLYQRWTQHSENNVEAVDCSAEEEEELTMFLQQSTALLMPQQRLLNGLPVGFLPA
jgi:hypothetical protein